MIKGRKIIRPDGKAMKTITILTPTKNYDPVRANVGQRIAEWLSIVGIPVKTEPVAFKKLIKQVKARHEFDLFILGYGNLSMDPDYLRSFFHSRNDMPNGSNMSGYQNYRFDQIADESANTMDENKRRRLVWEMQKIIMQDIPYYPLYNPKLSEGVIKGRFTGWIEMLGGVGNIWSFCSIRKNR